MPDTNAPYGIGCALTGKSRAIKVWEQEPELERALAKARKWTPASPAVEVIVIDNRGRCIARFAQEQ